MSDLVGRYRTSRVLGSGAFATVWLAHDDSLDADVAVKVLAENWAHDEDVRRRFAEEARILWRLDSDRIVRVHTVEELPDGRPFFVMDYADAGNLADRMRERAGTNPYTVAEAVQLGTQIAQALAVAHDQGVVHRDLKPSNVLFRSVAGSGKTKAETTTETERMVLADFGIARSLEGAVAATITAGTPHYMAPEQSEGKADRRSDVYAAAVVLYELLAGQVPYPYQSAGEVLRAQLTGPPAPIRSLRPEVPESLAAVVERGLAGDPDARYEDAGAWLAALEGEAARLATGEDDDRSASETFIRPAAAAGATAAAAGVGAAAAGGGGPAGPPPAPPGPRGAGAGRGGGRSRRRKQRVIAMLAAVALVGAVAGVAISVGGTKEAAASEIFLDPNADPGRDPFTPSVVKAGFTPPAALPSAPNAPVLPPPDAGGGIPSYSGGTPGLYGGTQQLSVCDKAQLISFLQATPDKGTAFAQVAGVALSGIAGYVNALTEVILRADTRVTNHGFQDGVATAVQSVLQAGTAVLVDAFGIPRVRCFCGNPLKEPTPVSAPAYTGPQWPTFNPPQITVVAPAPAPVTVIIIVDVRTGTPFTRPVGTNGGSDKPTTIPAPSTTPTTKSGTSTTVTGSGSTLAVSIMKNAFNTCVDTLRRDPSIRIDDATVASLKYTATATSRSNVYSVRITSADGSEGTWDVDIGTRDVTPTDATAREAATLCPSLA